MNMGKNYQEKIHVTSSAISLFHLFVHFTPWLAQFKTLLYSLIWGGTFCPSHHTWTASIYTIFGHSVPCFFPFTLRLSQKV